MKAIFKACLNKDLSLPLPQMTYADAINRYGRDNPDTRFGMEIVDLTDIVKNSGFKLFSDVAASGGVIKAIKAEQASTLSRKDWMLAGCCCCLRCKRPAWRSERLRLTSPIFKLFKPRN
jgi:aspartyl-tRNA synthetase